MEKVNYLTDEEITDVLRRIGIRQKPELDIAIDEYKKYWCSISLATPEGNNKDSSLTKGTSLDRSSFISK